MDYLVLIHVISISFWLGVISVEVIFERADINKDAKVVLHKLTDRFVELPIISVVAVTGLLLWARHDWALTLLPKVAFGLAAVLSNVICYHFVEKRSTAPGVFAQQSRNILWITIPGSFCLIVALYLGGKLGSWW